MERRADARHAPAIWRRGGEPGAIARFVVRRIAAGVVMLALFSLLVFAATEVLPGDAAGVILGRNATPERIERLRVELGLDRPVAERYVDWMSGLVRGDLGESYVARRPVSEIVANRLPNSLIVGGITLAMLIPLSASFGLAAGIRAGRRADRAISLLATAVMAVPEFVVGTVLVLVLALWLGWLPAVSLIPIGGSPLDAPEAIVLPVLALLLPATAVCTRYVRAAAADVAAKPYIEAARLNGVGGPRLLFGHLLPNSVAPAIQVFGLAAGAFAGGSVVVEAVFGYPGIGATLQEGVASRDLPLVQGLAIVLAAIALACMLVADLAVVLLTPRLRRELH